jgi:DedD protein
MAFFKFRKGGDEQPTPAQAPESIEALRKRARHRLIGASVLVLAGVIGFPLVFDNQPRPVAVDIPIEIPDRNKVKPLTLPAAAPVAASVATPPASAAVSASKQPEEVVISAPPENSARAVAGQISAAPAVIKPAPKLEPRPEPKPVEPVVEKSVPKPAVKVDDGAKAQALLEGKSAEAVKPAAASGVRFVVQVGAYADVVKAREARMKLERAGIKTYTQVVQAPEGKRIRVRVGPVESKAEVDKLAEKIRKLDLTAQILEL